MMLDPWDDAQRIAQRLAQPDARLVVLIGAMTWCQKCRDLFPRFVTCAASAAANETYLWLDLEQHAAFLDGFIPEDLPLHLTYDHQGNLLQALLWNADGSTLAYTSTVANLHARLCQNDWAQ